MDPILRRGDRRSEVETVQKLLNNLLEPSPALETDGKFGEMTESAVIRYQTACRDQNPVFSVDGDVGPQTWSALRSGHAPPEDDGKTKRGASWTDQYASKFKKQGIPGYKGLVGQIHFPTDVAALDQQDKSVLYDLCDAYQYYLMKNQVQLYMVGYADPRGSVKYNKELGMKRARTVKMFVDGRLARWSGFVSRAGSMGEDETSGDYASDRRVDIYSTYIPTGKPYNFPPMEFEGEYKGPLTKRFMVRVLFGGSLSVPVKVIPAGGQVLIIEIKNARTMRTVKYAYTGMTFGAGGGVNRPTGWTEQVTPDWMEIEDFAGRGDVSGVSLGVDSGTVLVFDGPAQRGKTAKPIHWTFTGWDLNFGVSRAVDGVRGEWHRF